jgi:hypothetical protein
MANIVFATYFVRYPLGGILSNALQYMLGMQRLGHDLYVVEKAGYPDSCFDPARNQMSDDCEYGVRVAGELLARFGLADKWCYVDAHDEYHGMARERVARAFRDADVFIDYGSHGTWNAEAADVPCRVVIDGEPGYRQILMEQAVDAGASVPEYDHYFTNGLNIGTGASSAPTAGLDWGHLFHPVDVRLFQSAPPPAGAPLTTVMNWQSHDPLRYDGLALGQKDVEFERFSHLPELVSTPLEIAIAGKDAPRAELERMGWRVRNGHDVTISYDSFVDYIASSLGEFAVCKQVFVALRTGWFSDRSAAYLASGRPVVLQETGFSAHLPVGADLFAVTTADEAAAAIEELSGDFARHSRCAREIAAEFLDAPVVMRRLLEAIGLS